MFVLDVMMNTQTPLPDYVSKQWEYLYDETKYTENGPQKAVDIKEQIWGEYLTCSLLHRLMRVCIQFIKNIDKEGEEVIQSLHLS